MTNLILTGMRGSGKSTIARRIAKTIKRRHIDIDKEIERQERKPIRKIVEQKGWPYFRKIEKYITRRIAHYDNVVISTGGGTMIDPENARKLKKKGIVVFLEIPIPALVKRLTQEEQENRPSLTDKATLTAEIEKVWEKRKDKYHTVADYIIDVSADSDNFKNDLKLKGRTITELVAIDHPEFERPEED